MSRANIQSKLDEAPFASAWRAMETPEGYCLGGGTTPGNGVEGWAPGAMFIDSDAAGAPQYNAGNKTTADWTEIGSEASGAKFAMATDETFEAGDGTNIIQSFTSGGVYKVRPLLPDTGAWNFGDGTTDLDLKVFLGSTSKHALFDVGDSRFQLTNVQMGMGVQGTGIPTLTATPFAFELHAETGAVALTAGTTGLTCGLRCRYEVSVDQTNLISFEAIDARLRVKADLADGNHCGVNGTIEASEAGTVLSGTSTTVRSGGFFSLDFGSTVSITSGFLSGVTIDSSVDGSVSMASCQFSGLYIKTSSGKEVWESAIYLEDDSAVMGITLGSVAGAGLFMAGTWGTGYNTGAILIAADASGTALAIGTVTAGTTIERVNVTFAATSGSYLFGTYASYATSADMADGYIMGDYQKITVAHKALEVYGQRGRIVISAAQGGDTSNQFIGLFGAVEVDGVALALTDTGGCYGVLGTVSIASSGTCDQPLIGGYFECDAKDNIAGLTVASRHRMLGYTDYGVDVLCQTSTNIAGIRIGCESSANLAAGISVEVSAGSGNVNHLFKLEDSTASCVNTSGYVGGGQQSDAIIKFDIGGTDYYIPAFVAGSVTGNWADV